MLHVVQVLPVLLLAGGLPLVGIVASGPGPPSGGSPARGLGPSIGPGGGIIAGGGPGPAASIAAGGGCGPPGGGCGPGGGSPRPAALVKRSHRQPPTHEKKDVPIVGHLFFRVLQDNSSETFI